MVQFHARLRESSPSRPGARLPPGSLPRGLRRRTGGITRDARSPPGDRPRAVNAVSRRYVFIAASINGSGSVARRPCGGDDCRHGLRHRARRSLSRMRRGTDPSSFWTSGLSGSTSARRGGGGSGRGRRLRGDDRLNLRRRRRGRRDDARAPDAGTAPASDRATVGHRPFRDRGPACRPYRSGTPGRPGSPGWPRNPGCRSRSSDPPLHGRCRRSR